MRRRGSDHLDVAAVLELAERPDEIAVVGPDEVLLRRPVECTPRVCEAGGVPVPDRLEFLTVPLREFPSGIEVRYEILLELGGSEHLA